MPYFEEGDTSIYFEERGAGFPLLALAPGGMRSSIPFWPNAALDPWESYQTDFRVIAMDQRNAGQSRGPLDAADPWGSYASDQLGLLDHLGVDRCVVLGCCIGCSFVLKLIEVAPERISAAVLEQPIGVSESNQELFGQLQRSWAQEILGSREDLDAEATNRFLTSMWADDFVVSVGRQAVTSCPVPLFVLPGIDEYHPTEVGREVAALAPDARIFEPWKDTPEHVAAATVAARDFLIGHAG